jgi:hypothetical protein
MLSRDDTLKEEEEEEDMPCVRLKFNVYYVHLNLIYDQPKLMEIKVIMTHSVPYLL